MGESPLRERVAEWVAVWRSRLGHWIAGHHDWSFFHDEAYCLSCAIGPVGEMSTKQGGDA